MLRGEFIRADGLVIPNNITKFGAGLLLALALRATDSPFWVGLVDGVPDAELKIEDLDEPTIGVNGYARQQLNRNSTDWPVTGLTNDEPYIESKWLTWTAALSQFESPIRRLMLVTSENATSGDVFALSASLAAPITITTTTPESQRKFKYRIYLR